MNEQQGRHLDERVRQALDELPDVPAPGSTFDAAKLWEQLRPELAAETVVLAPRQTGQVQPAPTRRGWLVAASLAGLLVVWLWWSWQPVKEQSLTDKQGVETIAGRYVRTGRVARPTTGNGTAVATPRMSALKAKGTGKLASRKAKLPDNTPLSSTRADKSVTQPEPIANVPEQLPAESRPVIAEPIDQSSVVAVQVPKMKPQKRRFRVVHANELNADDEATVFRHLTKTSSQPFVRIGTGDGPRSTTAGYDTPSIRLPLTRQLTQ